VNNGTFRCKVDENYHHARYDSLMPSKSTNSGSSSEYNEYL